MHNDDHVMRNLKVVASVKANQKLNTSLSEFTVQDKSLLSGASRLWWGERRQENVVRIADLFRMTMLRCKLLQITGEDDALLVRLLQLLTEALQGLQELLVTYRDDITLLSHIQVLQENVQSFLANAEHAFPSTPRLPSARPGSEAA